MIDVKELVARLRKRADTMRQHVPDEYWTRFELLAAVATIERLEAENKELRTNREASMGN